MTKEDIKELKRRVGIQPYLDMGFLNTTKHQPCRLPGHNQVGRNTKPDFRLYEEHGEHCWICTCGSGDVINCIGRHEKIDNRETTKIFMKKYGNASFPERPNYDNTGKKKITAEHIYNEKSYVDNIAISIIKKYFLTRNIKLTDDEIKYLELRFNPYYDAEINSKGYVVYPIRNAQNELITIGKIPINEKCEKVHATILHSDLGNQNCCYSFNNGKEICCITEGIEDALTIYYNAKDGKYHTYIVASSATNFNKLGAILKPFKEKITILDNDTNGASIKHSECLKTHGVKRFLSTYEGYKDANEALLKDKLKAWSYELKEVEYQDISKADKQQENADNQNGNSQNKDSHKKDNSNIFNTISGYQIGQTEYKPLHFVVKDLIPEGLTIIGGKPKLGKSYLLLDMALAITTGQSFLSTFETNKGDILYFALEDGGRRIKDRIEKLGYDFNELKNIHFAFQCPDLDSGFCEKLTKYLEQNKDTKLVVIDTFAKIFGQRKRKDIYFDDYQKASLLKDIADKFSIAIVLIHHVRKQKADDFIDELSSSTGLTGVCDSILHFSGERHKPERKLQITSREIKESDYSLREDNFKFILLGNADKLPKEQRKVYEVIKEHPKEFQASEAAKAIAEILNKNSETIRSQLRELFKKGCITVDDNQKIDIHRFGGVFQE